MGLSSALPPCTSSGKTWVKSARWPDFRNQGIGSGLVKKCIEEARDIGVRKVFALTTRPEFFIRLGFRLVPNDDLPRIIWSECKNCVKFPDKCDEVPMLLDLGTPGPRA
jgi:amino-acid N-acetyltransferase